MYVDLLGYYYSNTDNLKDYGQIHFSIDSGKTWINITDYQGSFGSPGDPAVLTGNSGGWKFFEYNFQDLKTMFNFPGYTNLILRFSFKSDSTFDNLDGLMFDDLEMTDYLPELVHNIKVSSNMVLSPSPSSDNIHVRLKRYDTNLSYHFYITDLNGRMIEEQQLNRGFTDFKY